MPDLPLVEGDRVRTEQGRAEILLGDGSALHMDAQTSVDINGASIVRLLGGRLVVFGEPSAVGALQVDAAPASVRLTSSGESRISLYDGGAGLVLDVAVVRGAVEVVTDGGTSYVQAGQRVLVEEGALPSTPVPFNSAQMDSFYRWSAQLLDQRRGTQSAAYLPDELTSYGSDFDSSGSWSYLAPYGYVWYPTVGTGWCPYSHGRWTHVGHGVGWSFVGNGSRWTYPTHHYGRWGMNASGGWFWIPRPHLVVGVGAVGRVAGLRRVVPARGERSARGRLGRRCRRHAVRASRRTVARMDGDAEDHASRAADRSRARRVIRRRSSAVAGLRRAARGAATRSSHACRPAR